MNKQNLRQSSQVLIAGSLIAIIFSAIGFLSDTDVWLNSTTWLLVAAVLGIFAVYLRLEA
ncbi:hypothetical protein A2Z23_03055 [Candidatus Curtissbacteria bacterium RBG_16_39_7]|uniref:Uncharacterized protein n=1 Tax=Candidatus Curtissbacteria bacterium RBG_16_39_7 TaxID=1797707 RepID=A0A1F5G495_9BACT|nr:MAG: hypothetical protein A2Z23_03055 [Candidatus Curtissbacteria bacterium RBG_16_39_7]